MRALPTLLLAASILLASGPAFAQGGDDDGTPTPREAPGRGSERRSDAADEHARDGNGRRGGEDDRPRMLGAFDIQARPRAANGTFLSFQYNDTGVQGFTAGGVTLFDLQVTGGRHGEQPRAIVSRGAQVSLVGEGFRLVAHDNPGAVSKVETDGQVRAAFLPGATLAMEGKAVRFALGNATGLLRGADLAIEGLNVTSRHGLLVFLDTPHGAFDVHRGDIGKAIGRGHVGLEATFHKEGEDVREDVVSYGNVTLTTLRAERGNLTVQVDGHGSDGRVLVLNVDGRVLGASRAEQLQVLFDEEGIEPASNLTDVLDPDDDGLDAEYYVVFDPGTETFQLLVSVPHYSVHTLSVMTFVQQIPPSVLVGVVAGVALLVPSAMLLFRRRSA